MGAQVRIGSLFAGIGGFDLAARWMGWKTAWYSEIEPWACGVMARHFPDATNHGDIRGIRGADVEAVDLLAGGFPCQDISNAGLRAGLEGEQSGLWREYARLVRECRPRWVVVENVAALLGRGYGVVRGDLRAAGYRVSRPVVMSASQVGAPHLRERCWIVAHAEWDEQPRAQPRHGAAGRVGREFQPVPWDRPWEDALCEFRGMDDGLSYGVERLDGLRNAVVPHCALAIFEAIAAHDTTMTRGAA